MTKRKRRIDPGKADGRMFSKRNILNCILVIILIVVAIVVYSPWKKSSEKKAEETTAKSTTATTQKSTTKSTTEDSAKKNVQSSYEEKYGKEFCAFVYDEVMKKKKTSEVQHHNGDNIYVLKDNIGFVYKEYYRFGIESGNYVVFECNEYQYQSKNSWLTKYIIVYMDPKKHNGKTSEVLTSRPSESITWFKFNQVGDFKVE